MAAGVTPVEVAIPPTTGTESAPVEAVPPEDVEEEDVSTTKDG